jgi:hypothetical protein
MIRIKSISRLPCLVGFNSLLSKQCARNASILNAGKRFSTVQSPIIAKKLQIWNEIENFKLDS